MKHPLLILWFAAIFFSASAAAIARPVPGPDDPQGSYDETVTAKWDETSAASHTFGSLTMTYHVDFWLVGRVSGVSETYVPDGNYTFSVKGGGTDASPEGVSCAVSGTVGGSGPIKGGTVIIRPANGEWYFTDLVLGNLRDGLNRAGACHLPGADEWDLNFGGKAAFDATPKRLVYHQAASFRDGTCNNEDSVTSDIIPTWFPLPNDQNNIHCDVSWSWQFKGRVGAPKTIFISPFSPIRIGPKKPPVRRRACSRFDIHGKPVPCLTPAPKAT
ncbi:MAG: hypothetical protein NVSMB31_14210 [Vulcanimicrobiaceae bacterium]